MEEVMSIPAQSIHDCIVGKTATYIIYDEYSNLVGEKIMELKPPKIEWCVELNKIQQHYPEAIIGGGALRDLNTERPIKDLDVFLQYDDKLYKNLCDAYGEENISDLDELSESLYEDMNTVLGGVYEVAVDGLDIPLQIIGMTTFGSVEKVSNYFDINLCKLFHDGIEYVGGTDGFKYDYNAGVMTMESQDYETVSEAIKFYNRSMKHACRLLEKYQGFVIVLDEQGSLNIEDLSVLAPFRKAS